MPAKIDSYQQAFQKSKSKKFIELGVLTGSGMQMALDAGFQKVIGIELSKDLCIRSRNRFYGNGNVIIIEGDVEIELGPLLKKEGDNCAMMIDAHYSGEGTAEGLHGDPIWQVLDIIEKSSTKDHILLIDDMRSYDKEGMQSRLSRINHKYKYKYLDGHVKEDVLLAYL